MSKKEISIIIRARNMVAAGLNSAGKALKSFGSGAMHLGRNIAIGLAAATAAVGAFAAKALSAYATQERAAKSLSAALTANGDDALTLVPKLQKVAAAIQDETGADDDAVIAGMAKMRMLGVQADKLDEAAKATMALTSIGMDEAAAQKAVALAMQGNYTLLQRYIPALKNAKDETEKARIVNELFARGYEQQKALLGTTSGAWAALKGRVGDVWEEFGKAIERSGGLTAILLRAGDAVKAFGQRVSEWIDSEKFKALQQSIQGVLNALMSGGESRGQALDAMLDVIKAGFSVAAENAVDVLKRAAGEIGGLIADGFKKLIKKTPYTKAEIDAAAGQIGQERGNSIYERMQGRIAIRKRDWAGFSGDQEKAIKEQIKRNRLEAEGAVVSENLTVAENKLALAIKRLQKVAKDNTSLVTVEPPAAQLTDVNIFDDAAITDNTEAIKTAKDKLAEIEKEKTEIIKAEQAKRLEGERETAQKQLAIAEEIAAKTVKSYIDEVKQKRAQDKQWSKDVARAEVLRGRGDQRSQDFVQAVDAIKKARGDIPGLQSMADQASAQLAAAQSTSKTLEQLLAEQKGINGRLESLMRMG